MITLVNSVCLKVVIFVRVMILAFQLMVSRIWEEKKNCICKSKAARSSENGY